MVGETEKLESVESDTNPNDVDIPSVIKHPLNTFWTFWMVTNDSNKTWEENLVKLTTFDTVEDYWCLYHWMKRPSELIDGQDYAVFRGDVTPMWEHPANKKGGRLIINFEKKRNSAVDMDTAWMYVVLLMIGENFYNSQDVCGAIINVRAKSKIGVWMNDARKETSVHEVGHKIKNQLGLTSRINFHKHKNYSNLMTI